MEEWLRLFIGEFPETPEEEDLLTDEQALRLAIREGFRGYGFTSPNPAVGCVILDRDRRFLASGYHDRPGEAHSEIVALSGLAGGLPQRSISGWSFNQLDEEKLKDARIFVTLEPCAHEGRTPSCAKTLAKLPFKEIIAILKDPNPQVAGQGFEILRQAGKKVRCLEDEGEVEIFWVQSARALCEFFLTNFTEKRCFVSLKVATSLDGIMALKNGESQWITGPKARDFARFLRGAHEACIVGKKTVLQDDPRLDARETPFAGSRRRLVILDSLGEVLTKPHLQIFKCHLPEDIFVCVSPESNHQSSSLAQVVRLTSTEGDSSLKQVLDFLWKREIRSVWIEGGSQTLSSALSGGIGDRLWLFQGPHLMGARFGRPWTEAWGVSKMQNRKPLDEARHLVIDSDYLTTGRLSNPNT